MLKFGTPIIFYLPLHFFVVESLDLGFGPGLLAAKVIRRHQDAVLRVEVNGVTQIAPVSETGRFELMLPAEADVVLHFELPGHLAKDVTVDTHHARDGDFRQRKRHLEFAVVMEPQQGLNGMVYAGPVGVIGFDEGGGCIAVSHNKSLVPANHNAVMVF